MIFFLLKIIATWFVVRLLVKYEDLYLNAYTKMGVLHAGLTRYFALTTASNRTRSRTIRCPTSCTRVAKALAP